MSYSPEHYEDALALRKQGKDDASIRMILVSKRLSAQTIDELFFALDEAMPRNKLTHEKGYEGDETRRKIERRDFYILMIGSLIVAGVLGGIGYFMENQILMGLGGFIGIVAFIFTMDSLKDDLDEWQEKK